MARSFFAPMALLVLALPAASGCGGAGDVRAPASVRPAPPPADDGKQSKGGQGGAAHSAALEQLRTAPMEMRADRQRSVELPLPDARRWTRVKFLTMPSLVGFRYGKEHHAIVGAFTTRIEGEADSPACMRRFEEWAMPFVDAFEVALDRGAPGAFSWDGGLAEGGSARHRIVELDRLGAKTATILSREAFAVAYAAYPAWPGTCVVLGVAVPERDDPSRAAQVRDRFAADVLPRVRLTRDSEPEERY